MGFSVDRIYGNIAVLICKNGERKEVCSSLLPKGTKEGDVLDFENGKYIINDEKTKKLKEENYNLLISLINKNEKRINLKG